MTFRPLRLVFFLCCLSASTAQALATPTLRVDASQPSYTLAPWIEILEDPGSKLGIDDVTREPYASQFTPNRQAIPNFGFSRSAFWVRLRLRNSAAEIPEWMLEQRYANTHYLDLYHPDGSEQGFIRRASGNLLPLDRRDVSHQRIVFKLPLPEGEEQTIYLRLKNGSSSTIDLKLWQPEAFAADDLKEVIWLGIFAGSMLFFLCYNLLMWAIQRDRNYLWQALFVTGILGAFAFYKGYGQILLSPALVYWSQYATSLFMSLSIIAILGFVHSFLPPRNHADWRERLHKGHLALWAGMLLLIPFLPYTVMVRLIAPLSAAYLIYVLAWAIMALREGQPAARLFLCGWSVFLLSLLLIVTVRLGWIEPNLISEGQPLQLSLIWLVLFSAMAQASRVHHLRQESERISKALQHSENQRRLAMQTGRIGTWSYQPDRQRLDYSPEAATLAGLNRARLSGHFLHDYETLRQLVHDDDWPRLAKNVKDCLQQATPLSVEFRLADQTGDHWLQLYGEMHGDANTDGQLLAGTLQDISERKQREAEAQQSEETLKAIASAVSSATGEAFFRELALSIARLFDIDHVIIGLREDGETERVRSIALCIHGKIRNNISYDASTGPCHSVIHGELRNASGGMRQQFPHSELLDRLGADSYVGTPLLAYHGRPLGLIAVLNSGSIENGRRIQSILRIFAVRASAELQRLKTEQALGLAQRRLAQHIRDTPLAVIEWNPQMEVTAWNPGAERIFGFSEAEALGKHATELILTPDLRPYIQPAWDALMEKRGGTHNTNDNVTKDRGIITCNWFNTPLLDEQDRVIGIASMVTDITEQVQAQKELTRHHDHLEELVNQRSAEVREQARIIDQLQDAVLAIDMQGHVSYWNQGAVQQIGYSKEEALGQFIGFIHHKTDPVVLPQVIAKLHRNDKLERELQIRRKDGTHFTAHLSLSLRRDVDGKASGIIGIIIDISERKRVEVEMEKQRLALKNTNRELEAFSYSVSHDLRAPLRSLNGFSLALLEDYGEQLDDTARDYIERLRGATLRMSERIDSLLILSRLSRSHMQREPIDLSHMAEEIRQQLEEREPQRKVEWDIQSGITAHADAALINAVLDNLLGNAWKYTAGTAAARIRFEAHQSGRGFTYTVSDNGAGFDMQHSDKLFAPFQRLHNATDFPGSGVGLATVARIVHRHGGEVWAEAEIGKGASFHFTLPTD